MGKGANIDNALKSFSWEEIKAEKKWIVINDKVYDVSRFKKKHPGGEKLLMNHISEDATDAFMAFHKNLQKVSKYMKTIEVGKLSDEYKNKPENKDEVIEDFRKIKLLAEKMGLYDTNYLFFFLHFAHIVIIDLLAWYIMSVSGYGNWLTYLISVFLLTTAQAQAGWYLFIFFNNNISILIKFK
jgi:fatty acid desaturase 1 (delta-5 desaturase)